MAKVIGTVINIGGATIITLYKGMPLMNLFKSSHILGENIVSPNLVWNWTVGCLFLLGNCFAWSGWMVLQVSTPTLNPSFATISNYTIY
jgi:hypothetical protein